MAKISVFNTDIIVLNYNAYDYISLVDTKNFKRWR